MRHVGVRQRPPVAADGVECAPAHFGEPGQLGQSLVDYLARALALATRCGEEVERPQRQRRLLGDGAIEQMDQLETPAPQVAHDAVRLRAAAQHAERRHLRFFGAREYAHAKTAPPLDLGDELSPVLRVAHRSGGDGVEARHSH